MKWLKVVLAGAIVLSMSLIVSQQVFAHVLIHSNDKNAAAILHVIPDDDPIAGEPASLMLDTQSGVVGEGSTITLTINDTSTQTEETITTSIDGSLVSAKYIFPSQGVYHLRYVITSGADETEFEQEIRVSRGVGATTESQQYVWAEALLFIVSVLFVVLSIVGWNNRHDIFKSSTF